MAKESQHPQSLFLSRDESWLSFNRRVLEEAQDNANPLLERVKFLAITASNLDEFFEIRVAGVLQRIEDGYNEALPDGATLRESLDAMKEETQRFVADQYRCWNQDLLPAMHNAGIRVLAWDEMDQEARRFANEYYQREVDPLLTPITIDPAHPFPRVLNKAMCLALLLRRKRRGTAGPVLGVLTVPRALPRFVRVPTSNGAEDYIFLADLIERNAGGMYRGYEILSRAAFRVTRNSNLYFQEEESRSLLETVRAELHNRRKGDAVRLEIDSQADPEIVDRLRTNFELDESLVYHTDGPVNLSRVMTLYSSSSHAELKFRPFVPRELRLNRKSVDLFDEIAAPRHPAAPSLRLLRRRRGFHRSRGAGPQRRLHEADALPHQRRLAHLPGAHRSRADQGSHRHRRADGPLRRGLEYPLGAQS